ncbi:hypothetical protein [Methanocorpusculum bavaricum]|uniref:hypothetical protein n=1 Tax=Methanocorpusculum bavaricum TaxID=71518 RepID=UPI0005B26436|nr:hypothetical protein [Methanocorpusculum bavaricum]
MTADFIQTAISKSAKRIFTAEFTNAAAYDAIIAEITGVENPLGLAEVELGKQTYKTYVGYFDPNTSRTPGSEKRLGHFYLQVMRNDPQKRTTRTRFLTPVKKRITPATRSPR